jgi:hypothetical protein
MVRADFLERVRRYSFLLTLAFSVYLAYAVYAGQITLQLDKYRGVDNSAWLGSVVGLVASVWLSLVGFYIVKNAIQRDRQTRVGQILATTPISKSFYTLGKALSNFAVLATMVLALTLAAFAIHLFHRADPHIDFYALFSPILFLGLSAVAVTAALAVLFESLPVLRGGVGNILYFFLWIALLVFGAVSAENRPAIAGPEPFKDYTGVVYVLSQMQRQVQALDPQYSNGAQFNVGGLNPATKTFLWTGLTWTPALLLSRAMFFAIAIVLALLAALFFDRFDPARTGWLSAKKPKRTREAGVGELVQAQVPGKSMGESAFGQPQPHLSAAQLAALLRTGSQPASRTRFLALVAAEFRLLIRGHAWWWYVVAAGLVIACLASPLEIARSGIIVAAWLWPALLWSQLGTREAQYSTGRLIFSSPYAVSRQLLAAYVAGVLVAALAGSGLGLHLLIARDFAGLAAWAAAALFIPALALVLGVATGTRKFFEALYIAWWYVGPLHHIRGLDFMGTTPASSLPAAWLAAAALLVAVAWSWRRTSLAFA